MKIIEGCFPAGWIGLTLEEVAEIHDNLREPVNSFERAKRSGPYPYFGATGQVGWIDDFRQDGEYVLLGEDGAPFFEPTKEKAYLVSGKCWVNNHAHVLKGREGLCSNRYLLYALNQTNYRGHANGTTRLKLTQSAMRRLPINLAPLVEQHRIVAKIEELFSELDKGIENLNTARAQLKVYRQALLKHAFEGKLTAQWRADNQDKLETAEALFKHIERDRATRYQQQLADWEAGGKQDRKPKAMKLLPPLTATEKAELPELPATWTWVKVADLASKITDGEHFKPEVQSEGIYFLSAKDVQSNGVVFDAPLFVDEGTAAKARSRCDPERNDILIVSRGATVGRMCIVSTDEVFCLLGSVILIKALDSVKSNYFVFGLKSPLVNRKIVAASGATAQQAIYLRDIQHVPIPFCSLEEQQEISKVLDEKLSIVDALEIAIKAELLRCEALRQSILKKAFSGQLVPQEPHDEPASVLLARIRAERAGLAGKPRKKSVGDGLSPTARHTAFQKKVS